jgi:WD40 repeat protein
MPEANIYTTGGTVQAGSGIYIRRQTDDELLDLCRKGEFAYVLTPRQLGKSSLMVDTAQRLAGEGIRSVIIDLSVLGAETTPEQWYLGVLATIEARLSLETDVTKWWLTQKHLSPTYRLTNFFESVLLKEVAGSIVIFVDEIDNTLNLPFRDDFFAAIRYFYNARAHKPELERLSFVIIGVATPGDLINDPLRTPFNIGRWVVLSDFDYKEASPLAAGLNLPEEEARRALGWILEWTGGHPYLTQRLCLKIAERRRDSWSKADVALVVADTFLGARSKEDANLQFVRDMLTLRVPRGVDPNELLRTYRKILRSDSVADEEHSVIKSHLKLSGLVRREGAALRVRNPIYREVFDGAWVRDHLPVNWKRRLYRTAVVLIGLVIFSLIPLSAVAVNRAWAAERALASAEEATRREKAARQATVLALQREQEAKSALLAALQDVQDKKEELEESLAGETAAKREAQVQREKAEAQRLRAEQKSAEAERQRREAERLRQVALSREVAASASLQLPNNPELSVLLARESLTISETAQAKDSLREALLDFRLRATLAGHKKPVGAASYSPDGRRIVTASDDGVARVWDAATGRALFTLSQQDEDDEDKDEVWSALFSPDGRYIVTAGEYGTAGLWNASDGKLLFDLDRHRGDVETASFSRDGKLLVTADEYNNARVWDTASGACVFELEMYEKAAAQPTPTPTPTPTPAPAQGATPAPETIAGSSMESIDATRIVNTPIFDRKASTLFEALGDGGESEPRARKLPSVGACFSPDGRNLLTQGSDGNVRVWNVETHALLFKLEEEPKTTLANASYSPDGTVIIAAGQNDAWSPSWRVQMWDAKTGKKLPPIFDDYSAGKLMPLFSPDGSYVVVGGRSNTAVVWDIVARQVSFVLQGHTSPIRSATFSPDGKLIATIDDTNAARVWNAEDGHALYVLQGHASTVLDLNFSPEGRHVVTAGADNTVRVWDVDVEPKAAALAAWEGLELEGSSFSPDGSLVLAYEENGAVRVSEVATGRERYKLGAAGYAALKPFFSPDGKYVVADGGANSLRVWDAASGRDAAQLRGHTGRVLSASFSRDNTLLITTSDDATARIWEVGTWRNITTLTGHKSDVRSADISPGKSFAVTAGDDNTARVWDAATGKQKAVLLHASKVLSAAVSPDGKYIVTGDSGGDTYVWDSSNGENLSLLEGAYLLGYKPSFSSDGRLMVTLGPQNVAQVWDVFTGRRVAILQGHTDKINAFGFAAGGEVLVTVSKDGSTRVWDPLTGKNLETLTERGLDELDDTDPNSVLAATIRPESGTLITSNDASTLHVYACDICVPTDHILGMLDSRVTRGLTAREKETYLHSGGDR